MHTDVLARFNIKGLADAARREAHQNSRPKASAETASASTSGKKSKSAAAKKIKMIKVGKAEVLVCGLNAKGQLQRTTALSAQEVEELFQYRLARKKGGDDGDLEFGDGGERKKLTTGFAHCSPNFSNILILSMVLRAVIGLSDDLAEAKGSAARGWRECAVRIATRHALPSAVYKDWPGANAKARAGDRFPSEPPSDSETKTKSKASRQRGKGKGKDKDKDKAQSISSDSPESEEPLLSGDSLEDSDHSGVEDVAGLSTLEPRRRNIAEEVDDSTSRRTSLSSGSGMSAQDHDFFCGPDESELHLESDLLDDVREAKSEDNREEWEVEAENWKNLDDEQWYTQLQYSRRKRSGTLLSNASDQEDRKRHKSTTQHHPAGTIEVKGGSTTGSSVVASSSSSIPSSSASILPPDPSNSVYTARPKRGFNVPKAMFDLWNSK
ncbi:hypothetical protein B0H13DRAFT_2363284 [Mycena leptocephala]|nr:hypothetical protein B0H13DRAFT_2363284 [Mycena leptocephala]